MAIVIGSLLLFSKMFSTNNFYFLIYQLLFYPFSAGFHPYKSTVTTAANISMVLNQMESFLTRILIILLHSWCLISLKFLSL